MTTRDIQAVLENDLHKGKALILLAARHPE